jgi:hypothetical protein
MIAWHSLHSLPDYEFFLLCLTWFWITFRSLLLRVTHKKWHITSHLRMNHGLITCSPLKIRGEPNTNHYPPTVHVIMCLCFALEMYFNFVSVAAETCLAVRCLAMDVSEVLLWLQTSGTRASCHNIDSVVKYSCPKERHVAHMALPLHTSY